MSSLVLLKKRRPWPAGEVTGYDGGQMEGLSGRAGDLALTVGRVGLVNQLTTAMH